MVFGNAFNTIFKCNPRWEPHQKSFCTLNHVYLLYGLGLASSHWTKLVLAKTVFMIDVFISPPLYFNLFHLCSGPYFFRPMVGDEKETKRVKLSSDLDRFIYCDTGPKPCVGFRFPLRRA
jgi:hypothetical protein